MAPPAALQQHSGEDQHSLTIRTSVTLPRELHETLADLAKNKKVSVAWIIRDAAEKYVSDRWPLLKKEAA